MRKFVLSVALFVAGIFGGFNFNIYADWSDAGTINGVRIYRDNLTGLEWTTTLGRVPSSDRGSSARDMVAQYGFRLPSFFELQQMQRHGGFAPLNIRSAIGNYYETSNSNYLANAAINGFQTPQQRKGTGRNWVIGVRESSDTQVVVVQTTTVQEQQVTVTPTQTNTNKITTTPTNVTTNSTQPKSTITPVAFNEVTVTATPATTEEVTAATTNPTTLPNPLLPPILPAPANIIKPTLAAVKETLEEKIELIRETLTELSPSNETIIAKLKEKKISAADQAAMLTAIEEGDSATVQRIWLEASDNVKEAGQLSKTIKLKTALDTFTEELEDEDAPSFKLLRRTFDKNKLDKDADKKIKPALQSVELYVEVYEKLLAMRPAKKSKSNTNTTTISTENFEIPEDNVTIIIQPKQNPKEIFAIDESTFIVGKKTKKLDVINGSLDDFMPKLPFSEAQQIVSEDSGNQITLSNPAENKDNIKFSLADRGEKLTLAVGETKSYALPATGQIKVYVTKTRAAANRRRTAQTYQDTQTLAVKAGITYDFQIDADKNVQLVPRPVDITLDNSEGTTAFNLLVDGQTTVVEVAETKVFKSDNGVLTIKFAQSNDANDTVSIDFYKSQTCKPAVSKKEGKWALFQK
ncbi:MAG: hypothetical protein LBP59_15925 [Planctomycetaceae bacterium]|jgi:hypothetical protein|nr:hypothetical protein [Planctomycetaceae bacterium]